MRFALTGGPMNGAVYVLTNEEPSTTRKPDGLWFDALTENLIPVRHQYREVAQNACRNADGEGVELLYAYEGTNLEWEIFVNQAAERALRMIEAKREATT